MKSVLLAMAEENHDKRSWRCTLIVGVFIVLSLALNASAREQAHLVREISDSSESVIITFISIVTVIQLISLCVLLQPLSSRGEMPNKEALGIIVLGHLGGTFLHDFLASLGDSESSVAVNLAGPVLALLAIWSVTSFIPRTNTWTSCTIIAAGCIFMTLNKTSVFQTDRTSLVGALSVVFIVLRNIVTKQVLSNENVEFKPRGQVANMSCTGACFGMLMTIFVLFSVQWLAPTLCAIFTCCLSVGTFYISTHLLKTYSVVFVSLFQSWAILVEALIMTPSEHRPDLFIGLAALGVMLMGHYLFFKDYLESGSCSTNLAFTASKLANTHEQFVRIEFLLFFCSVLGVVFCVFQPKVSQRDLDTLSYIGLDKVVRHLLAQPEDIK